MKYRTFRNIALLAGAATLAGLGATCYHFAGGDQPPATRTVAGTAAAPSGAAPAAGVTANTSTTYPAGGVAPAPARPVAQSTGEQRREDRLILDFLAARPAATAKVTDAFPGERFKVNFYRDEGSSVWTRIKIDSDRDGKDDEKWDLKDGQLAKRRVATRDDEQYDREYRWRDSQWVEKK